MVKRIITSFIGLAVFFAVIAGGIVPYNSAVCILIAIMLFEYFKSVNSHKALLGVGYLSAVAIMLFNFLNVDLYASILVALVIFLTITVVLHGKESFKDIFSVFTGTLFISLFMSAVIKIRAEYGIFGALIIFVCAWTTDTGAYFAGRFLGKHKLAPHISPKKTIEGSVGGVITSALCCALYLFIMRLLGDTSAANTGYVGIMVVGAVGSAVSQIGDLVASAIKRDCGVKDFGNILPGHGGVLDRFDSVLFVAPFVYLLLKIFM